MADKCLRVLKWLRNYRCTWFLSPVSSPHCWTARTIMNTYECPKAIYSLLLSVLTEKKIPYMYICYCRGCYGVKSLLKFYEIFKILIIVAVLFFHLFLRAARLLSQCNTRKAKIGYDHNIHIVARLLPRYLSQPSLASLTPYPPIPFPLLSLSVLRVKRIKIDSSGDIGVMITHFCMIMKSKITLWWERLFRFVTTICKSER